MEISPTSSPSGLAPPVPAAGPPRILRLRARDVLAAELPHLHGRRARWVLKTLLAGWSPWLEVTGPAVAGETSLQGLPEPAIFALNHNNSVESILAPALLLYLRQGRPVRFLVDWMFLHLPPAGWVTGLQEGIPVWTKPALFRLREGFRRRNRRRNPIAEAVSSLETGTSVGLFPEGTRNGDSWRLLPGRRGLGRLALATGAPVVPVGLAFPARHRLGRMPRCGRLRVAIGRPLTFPDLVSRYAPGNADTSDRPDGASRRRLEGEAVRRVMQQLAILAGKAPAKATGAVSFRQENSPWDAPQSTP